jgi:aminoglycoside phosphotransferase (APT) family kinase protein
MFVPATSKRVSDRRLCDPGLVDHPVRIGNTVRRAPSGNTAFVQRVLCLLEDGGVAWAPRALGIDELGREVISWIPGDTAASGDEIDLIPLAGIVRQLHDLTAAMVDGVECVIHDDLQPRNVVVRDRFPVGLIDWEQARPGRRVEDVAKLCWSFIEPTSDSDPVEIGERWRHLAEVYGLKPVGALLSTVLAQMQTCAEDIEREAAGHSVRHQALAARGDHVALRAMHGWAVANERPLRKGIGA